MGATATGSLKDAGQIVGLGRGATLIEDDGLCGGWFIGCKSRGREEKEEERDGKIFHVSSLM